MTMRYIHISDVKNSPAVFFNTGLDARSFARTKMSQNIAEEGYVVHPDGSKEIWKPAEVDEFDGVMQVWGPLFNGKRLDLLLTDDSLPDKQLSLQAVVYWIKAKLFLGETQSASDPAASFICFENRESYKEGSVFFGPEYLSYRCLFSEGTEFNRYNSPDLHGMNAAAFCVGAMLYTIFTKTQPFPLASIYQDMREGVFMPARIAAPALNEKLAELIQSALLLPFEDTKSKVNAVDILTDILKILIDADNKIAQIQSLFNTISEEKANKTEKEKKRYLLKHDVIINSKRFYTRNKTLLIGSAIGFALLLIIVFSTIENIKNRPTTAGMLPVSVVNAYYDAFSSMDFEFMEACIKGADKADITAVLSITAILRTRQAYEGILPNTIPAQTWKNDGGDLPAENVFGVTDMILTHLNGSEFEELITYRADYSLWSLTDEEPYRRSDILTLKPDRKNNWRITEIKRTER